MIGAILKVASAAGKGLMKGVAKLGKGAMKLLTSKSLSKLAKSSKDYMDDHKAKTTAADHKKDLTKDKKRFDDSILKEAGVNPERVELSQSASESSQSASELAAEFHLSESEKQFLNGFSDRVTPKEDKSITDALDPSIIHGEIEDAEFEEVDNPNIPSHDVSEVEAPTSMATPDFSTPIEIVKKVDDSKTEKKSEDGTQSLVQNNNSNQNSEVANNNSKSSESSESPIILGNDSNNSEKTTETEVESAPEGIVVPNQTQSTQEGLGEQSPEKLTIETTEETEVPDSISSPQNIIVPQKVPVVTPETAEPEYSGLQVPSIDPEIISYIAQTPNREEIVDMLNQVCENLTEEIEVGNKSTSLAVINEVNDKLNKNEYLFLDNQMAGRQAIYYLFQQFNDNSRVLGSLAKYLVTKDGDIAITNSMVSSMLSQIPAIQKSLDVIKAQEVMAESREVEKSEREDKSETENKSLLQTIQGGIKGVWNGIMSLPNIIGNLVDKGVSIFDEIMDVLLLIMIGITYLPELIKGLIGNLDFSGLVSKIATMLKKMIFTIWDIIKYMWWQYAPDVMGGKKGEFVWNGGDYYYKYKNSDGDVTGYQYNSYDASGNRVVNELDSKGNIKSSEVNGVTYKSNGDISSDDFDVKSTSRGGKVTFKDNTTFADKESTKQFNLGSITPVSLGNTGKIVYKVGGPNTSIYNYVKYKEGKNFKDSDSYVYVSIGSDGKPTTKCGAKQNQYAQAFFNYLNGQGSYSKEYNKSGIDSKSELVDARKAVSEAFNAYESYKNYDTEHSKDVINNVQAKVSVNGEHNLNTKEAHEKMSNKSLSFDQYGVVTNVGTVAVEKAMEIPAKSLHYSNTHRNSIFEGGNKADCSSYVTYLLKQAGVNLKSIYHGSPTTAIFKDIVNGGKSAQDKQAIETYKITTVHKGGSKPDTSKLKPGDISVFRDADAGHVIMYIGNNKYTHMGVHGNNTFTLDGSNWSQWTGGHKYIGSLRFNSKDAYSTRDTDQGANFDLEGDTIAGVIEYGTEGANDIKLENREHNDYRGVKGNVCERSNNPGNIRGTGKKSSIRTYPGWVGITKSGSGDFSTFENQMYGIYAFYRLLATQYLPKGQNTIRSIFYKYCPPGDHGQGAPTGYIKHVSSQTGLGQDTVIQKPEKKLFQEMMKSVYKYEGGTKRAPMDQKDLDEAWKMFSTHYKGQKWPIVPTVEPQIYGTSSISATSSSSNESSDLATEWKRRMIEEAKKLDSKSKGQKTEEVTRAGGNEYITITDKKGRVTTKIIYPDGTTKVVKGKMVADGNTYVLNTDSRGRKSTTITMVDGKSFTVKGDHTSLSEVINQKSKTNVDNSVQDNTISNPEMEVASLDVVPESRSIEVSAEPTKVPDAEVKPTETKPEVTEPTPEKSKEQVDNTPIIIQSTPTIVNQQPPADFVVKPSDYLNPNYNKA